VSVAFDTNVLVYAVDESAGNRHLTASGLVERALRGRRGVLILQTLAEFYSVTTRKMGGRPEDALRFLDRLRAVLTVHAASERDFDRATRRDARGLSFWDALIWATAERVGVRYLLSEDFQDGRVLGRVTFVDPFNAANQALLSRTLSAAGPGG
jgi:predicted nucleic acid-binding protein